MDSFLASAQKLEIEGLLGGNEENSSIQDEIKQNQIKDDFLYQQVEEKQIVRMEQTSSLVMRRQQPRPSQKNVTTFDVGSWSPEEIEKKTRDLYEKGDGVYSCQACEYKTSDNRNIKRHIEVHFEGLSYTCTLCNKEFRSKNSLIKHKSIIH